MKKLVSLLSCLFLLISIPVEGMAESSQGSEKVGVLMKEIGVAVSLPADMYVVTRETPKDATVWNRFNASPEVFISDMKDGDIYFYAVAADNSYAVYAWATDAEKNASFNLYDSKQLNVRYDELISQEKNSGIIASQRPIYESGTKTFFVFDCCEVPGSNSVTGRQYWTIYGGKNVNIKLNLFDGEITSLHKAVLEEIVDSMIIEPDLEDNEETVVLIPEIGVAAAVPSNMYFVTRGTPEESELWAGLGFEYKETTQFMLDENAYLIAMPGDFSYQIIIRKVDVGSNKDFNTLKTAKLESIYADFLARNASEGVIACPNPIYRTATKTFLIYDGCRDTEDADIYRIYQTVEEGKEITVSLYLYSGEIEASHKAVIERIADSMIVD